MPSCTAAQPQSIIQEIKPPSYLLTPCIKPDKGKIETNRDLLFYLYRLEFEYDLCSAKIEALNSLYSD